MLESTWRRCKAEILGDADARATCRDGDGDRDLESGAKPR